MNWIITINGLVISDEQELREQVRPLLLNPVNIETLPKAIMEAAMGTEPSGVIDEWSEVEPGACSCLQFNRPVNSEPRPGMVMEGRQESIDTKIAVTTSTELLQGLTDHFIMDGDTGFLLINNEDPPSIEQAGEMFRRVMGISVAAQRLEEFSKWQMGSLYDACENSFGEEFNMNQFAEMTEAAYNTIITSLNTYRAFSTKRYKLSFTHHKEAFYSKLEQDDEDKTLMHQTMAISELFQVSCVKQRQLFRYVRNYGIEGLGEDIVDNWQDLSPAQLDEVRAHNSSAITNEAELIERITVNTANKNYLFRYRGELQRMRGFVDAIPGGATDIVCTDDWKSIQAGQETNIPTWERPGVIVQNNPDTPIAPTNITSV